MNLPLASTLVVFTHTHTHTLNHRKIAGYHGILNYLHTDVINPHSFIQEYSCLTVWGQSHEHSRSWITSVCACWGVSWQDSTVPSVVAIQMCFRQKTPLLPFRFVVDRLIRRLIRNGRGGKDKPLSSPPLCATPFWPLRKCITEIAFSSFNRLAKLPALINNDDLFLEQSGKRGKRRSRRIIS